MKKLILTGIVAAAAMLFGAAPAKAQVICDFTVPFSVLNDGVTPVQGSSGSYHTIITQSGATYTVTVTGNNDGNPPTSAVPGTPAPPGPVPKSGVGSLSFNFGAVGGGLIQATGVTGTSDAYVGPVGGNLGGPNNVAFGTTGGAWVINSGFTLNYFTNAEGVFVAPRGGNTFTGTFTLNPGQTLGSVAASFQDSGQQYSASCVLIPEPATAALALPALLPLGLLMLRRRRKSADVVAEEPTV